MEEENFKEALIEFAERVEKLSNICPADVDLVEFLENFPEFDSNFDQLSLVKTLKDCLANEITLDSAIVTNQNHVEAVKKFQKSPKFVKFKQKTCDLLIDNVSKLTGKNNFCWFFKVSTLIPMIIHLRHKMKLSQGTPFIKLVQPHTERF